MTLRHAIVEATVPNAVGVQSYTAAGISNWSAGGLALVFISGDTASPTFGGLLAVGLVDSGGGVNTIAWSATSGSTTIPEDHEASVDDHAAIILDVFTGTTFASIARAQFSSALSGGVELNWTSVSGVGSRVFKIVVVLIEGFTNVFSGNGGSFTGWGFQGDACLHVPNGAGSFSSWPPSNRNGHENSPGLGGALRLGGVPQKAAYVVSDRNQDPLVSRGGRRTASWSVSSDGSTENVGTVTAFGSDGLTVSGTNRGMYAAMRSSTSDYVLALESLDGGTGLKTFTGLGAKCGVIVGFVCGVTSDDTFEADSAALAPFAYFVTDGVTTISLGFSQKHNGTAISGANPTATYSSYANGSILMVDHLNATDFAATVAAITSTGLNLQVSNGLSGTMMLFGFLSAPVVETPTAVPIPLVVPAPTVVIENARKPNPVPLPLVVPTPLRFVSPTPSAVLLPLVLPAPVLFTPVVLTPEVPPPDLGPSYHEALSLLLPRGLAWAKRPLT